MKPLLLLMRKELFEQWRTRRVLVAGAAFLLVGLVSPLLAWALPRLLESIPKDELGGAEILMTADPTVKDALLQYLGNFGLLPLLVVLSAMGTIANERKSGTAAAVLSRPVSRRAFLLAKWLVPALLYAFGTVIAAGGCLVYALALFGPVHVPGFLAANALLYLHLLLFLTLTLFGSALFSGAGGAAAFGLGGLALFGLIGAAPSLGRYTPAGLSSAAMDIVVGRVTSPGPAVVVTLVCIALLFAGTATVFARRPV